jgi:hypothetical protein
MDAFDFKEPSQPRNVAEMVWNIATILVLISICCVFGYTALTILSPGEGTRILPEGTLDTPTPLLPTVTPTSRILLPPTWTPGPTELSTPTSTPVPTQTSFPTDDPGVTATPLPEGSMSYIPQGEPQLIQDFDLLGCSWSGVGGAVTDLRGSPVTGLFVQLGGTLRGEIIDTQTSMTGIARKYGEGGYEFKLGDKPEASNRTMWVQLIDQAGLPLSDRVYFFTSDDCTKNLVYISFKQVK